MNTQLKTLVVGGAGFIGSHLVRALMEDGKRQVRVTGRRDEPVYGLPPGAGYVKADAADAGMMERLLNDADEVIDLAYASVPKTSFDDPVDDVLSNLPATVNLLRKSSECSLRRFLLVSSGGTVYGNASRLPIDEFHATNPVSPYGITKLAAEKYAFLFHSLSSLPLVVARPGNPYGPFQYGRLAQGFIGAALHATALRQKVTVFGGRGTVRDYIYVEDLARGLIAALEYGRIGETYNIGTGIGYDNRAVLDKIDLVVKEDGYSVECEHRPARAFDVAENVLSSARLTYVSGWRPQVDLHTGLKATWQWAKEQSFLA